MCLCHCRRRGEDGSLARAMGNGIAFLGQLDGHSAGQKIAGKNTSGFR